MKSLILFLLLFVVSSNIHSQNSDYQGYMGRKFAIKYFGGAGLQIGNKVDFGLNFGHGAEIEYVFNEKFSILGSFELQSYKKKIAEDGAIFYDNYRLGNEFRNIINNKIVLVKLRKYLLKRGSFAPYGTYFNFNVGLVFSEFNFYTTNSVGSMKFLVEAKRNSVNPIFGFQFGRQFVFAKRVIVDAGISSSLTMVLTDLYNPEEDIFGNYLPDENLMLSQLLRAYISIGFLAF